MLWEGMGGCQKEEKIIFTFLIGPLTLPINGIVLLHLFLAEGPTITVSTSLLASVLSDTHRTPRSSLKAKMLAIILSSSLAALVAGSALPHPEMPPLQERGKLALNSVLKPSLKARLEKNTFHRKEERKKSAC